MQRDTVGAERVHASTTDREHWAARVALVATCVGLVLQLARVFFPVVFNLGEASGTTGGALKAGLLALAISLAPLFAPVSARFLGGRLGLVVALGAMAAARVGVQVVHPVPLWLATLGMAIGLVALSLLLVALQKQEGDDGHVIVVGTLSGLAVDTALRTAFWTWDYSWQRGAAPILLALLASGTLVLLIPAAGSDLDAHDQGQGNARWGAALVGPFLFLQIVFLQNVAFVSSSGHLSLPAAGAIVLLGDAVAVATIAAASRIGVTRAATVGAAAVMIALAYLLRQVRGPGLIAVVLATQALAGSFLVIALSPRPKPRPERDTAWRSSLAFAVGSFGLVLFVVVYQIVYRVKLPVPNTVIAPLAASILALGGLGARQARRVAAPPGMTLVTGGLFALLVVPAGVALARPGANTLPATATSLRVMTYNVHTGGIDGDGQLNPEAIARVIEGQHPDVVGLQEVVRGWPGPGGIDLAEWLSHRLRMAYSYAPAADDQFGNVVLSRLPIHSHVAVTLPRVNAAMQRSYLATTIEIGGGQSINVIDTHLEGDRSDQPVQVQRLVGRWGHSRHTVIVGDMNMQPTNPNVSTFTAAGLVSAQDQTGQGFQASATHPKFPGDRPDWIFASPDLRFSGFVIGPISSSDHRPLVVTVGLG